ncbi:MULTISPECIES: Holliday junction branch migration protein RuvA [Prochlorococcus]|uniref:Holliday junction branch migration protein RuvA n=1 Tax=Prochlorococcus TaxID=1218 RepID=UPI000533A593|nr:MULTISPECIES: Holliday junction branch migration protein RuvA [Prochlorococcus]KGG12635.1 Holliday junction DNA helicase RuvA [Prochlorococcus sp. MIT 0601]
MISWLKGDVIQNWHYGTRSGLVLACNGVGYEVQLTKRGLLTIKSCKEITLWIHEIVKEDGSNLFGFNQQQERDLFRKLISVNGVGPQTGMVLLEDNDFEQLLHTIISQDIKKLTRSSGIGNRTAQRLVLELESKLSDFELKANFPTPPLSINELPKDLSNEVKSTLENLGFSDPEILDALKAVSIEHCTETYPKGNNAVSTQKLDFDSLFKKTLTKLNQQTG